MKIVVVGLGVQGAKRLAVAGPDVVATVDPARPEARFASITAVPLDAFEAVLVCTPDAAKLEIVRYVLGHGKHVLVEKPLLAPEDELEELATLAKRNGAVCYTAYNHRFEPHFVRMKAVLESGALGRVYRCRMFYGNGTARAVRGSWRDRGAGVLTDLGSHLLDTVLYWFGDRRHDFRVVSCRRFENAAFDHVVVASDGEPSIELEMTLLSPRNHFTCDVLGEGGSAHIESLCKWGPATFIHRGRKLPSGRPDEEAVTLVEADPTWALEYRHFTALCVRGEGHVGNDLWINRELSRLSAEALGRRA
jgi:scyllo-inositol 2-dehydrogenase (NADP+)